MDLVVPVMMSSADFETYVTQFTEEIPKNGSLLTGFTTSFLAILVSEIGDKTFFLAMIMALRYSHIIVFIGSYGALLVMTVLSTVFGKVATAWISPLFTNIIVTILFLYFGIKMLMDAREHEENEENEELKEVENELQEMEEKFVERQSGSEAIKPALENQLVETKKKKVALPNSHILSQAFIMTFLAEWGDRSQIATIALAASFNFIMVTLGALLGHFICTAAAVKIGTWISGKVSEKQVLTVGGIVFIISGICTAYLVIQEMSE